MATAVSTTIHAPDGQPVEYPARIVTVKQFEANNPGFAGRTRGFILRADLNDPDYAGLRDAIVRLGRSVYVDEPRALAWLHTRRGTPPARPRNPHGRGGKGATS